MFSSSAKIHVVTWRGNHVCIFLERKRYINRWCDSVLPRHARLVIIMTRCAKVG